MFSPRLRFASIPSKRKFYFLYASGDSRDVPLHKCYFKPEFLSDVDAILRGGLVKKAQAVDLSHANSVRNLLFGRRREGGTDLASTNIQRGRDHGIPNYSTVRAAYGLKPQSFEDMSPTKEVAQKLRKLYGSTDDVDAFVGMLAESEKETKGEVGETMAAVIRDQFIRLRKGDQYWYERILDASDVTDVKSLSSGDVVEMNTNVRTGGKSAMYVVQ